MAAEFNEEFEKKLVEGNKSRTASIRNTPISELAANRLVGESKTYKESYIAKNTEYLNASGLGQYTPAQLGDNEQLIRLLVDSEAYTSFGKNRSLEAQKFLSGIMESSGFEDSWPRKALKRQLGTTKAKEQIVGDPTRARVREFPPDVFPRLKESLIILNKTNPEAGAQLAMHMFGGFRPEDLTTLRVENINFRTGEVLDLEIKTKGGVQTTSGVLAPPLRDILKNYVGERKEGLVFANTKKNSEQINTVFDTTFPSDYLEVYSKEKGWRKEAMRVKKLRNLNETVFSAFGIDPKSEIRRALTFRMPATQAEAYASMQANRKQVEKVVARNVALFAGATNTTSVAQFFSDIGVPASNATSTIAITKEVLEDAGYSDAANPEYFKSLPDSGSIIGGRIAGQVSPEVSEAASASAIAGYEADKAEAELRKQKAQAELQEQRALQKAPPPTVEDKPRPTRFEDLSQSTRDALAKLGITGKGIAKVVAGAVGAETVRQIITDPAAVAAEMGTEAALLAAKVPAGIAGAVPMAMQPKQMGVATLQPGEEPEMLKPEGQQRMEAVVQKDVEIPFIEQRQREIEAGLSDRQEQGFAKPRL